MLIHRLVRLPRLILRTPSVALLAVAAGCDGADCITSPCPIQTAITANVASSAGGMLQGLYVDVATPVIARIPCDEPAGRCSIPGNAGTYSITIGATGHQSVQTRVAVSAVQSAQACGCSGVSTQTLQITLTKL